MNKLIAGLLVIIFSGALVAGIDGNDNKGAEPSATVSIEGTVTDFTSGEALAGVEVSIEGTGLKAYTDFDGNFRFNDLKAGKYNIIASYISYKNSLVENFEADDANEEMDIKLQED